VICGVDPGLSGAIAYIGEHGVTVYDMPTRCVRVSGQERRRIDMAQLATIFELHEGDVSLTVIEEVHSQPHDGHVGAFSFGKAAGCVELGAHFTGGRIELVAPSVWKTQLGLAGQDKNASRALAIKLFPSFAQLFARVKDDGRAEATLLAFYGSKLK
jgi:crossover junction endodeoxyribonuclease RuvC